MIARAAFAFLLLCCCPAAASPAADWKYLIDSRIGAGEPMLHVFFLASEIERAPNNHVRVWTKGLAVDEVEKMQLDKDAIDRVARKLIAGYRPPFTKLMKLSRDQLVDVIALEEKADLATLQPHVQELMEFDCSSKMERTLSIAISMGGKFGSEDKPGK